MNERTPVYTEGICGDGAMILRDGQPFPISSAIDALNAYTSTEALRSALADELVWHEAAEKALSKQPPSGDRGWRRAEHQERIDAIRAALSGSPAPSTEGLREWQPIETAPRDGTAVLGIDAKGRTRKMWWFAPSSRTQHWMNCETQSPFKAVGWMPLPPAPDAARTALAGVTAPQSSGDRIKVTARGISIQADTFALAERASEMAGPGAEIRYIPEGSEAGWCVWTEGEEWPDREDFRYHLFALEVKRLRRERHSLSSSAGVTAPSEVDGK